MAQHRRAFLNYFDPTQTLTSRPADLVVRDLMLTEAAAGAVSGTGAITQAIQTLASSALMTFQGTAAASQVVQTVAATGAMTFQASGGTAQVLGLLTGSGGQTFTGASDLAQAVQALAATGSAASNGVDGTGATQQTIQGLGASALLTFQGGVDTAQAQQVGAASGSLAFTGTGDVSQAVQAVDGAGGVPLTGTGDILQPVQAVQAAGAIPVVEVPGGGLFRRQMPQQIRGDGGTEQALQGTTGRAGQGIGGVASTWQPAQSTGGSAAWVAPRARVAPPKPAPVFTGTGGTTQTAQSLEVGAGVAITGEGETAQAPQRVEGAGRIQSKHQRNDALAVALLMLMEDAA